MADVQTNQDQLQELLDTVDGFVDELIVPFVVNDMKRLAPVDTGELRDSIEAVGGGRINIAAKHAGDVEFGTKNMAAQPYARPALYRKRGE
jgi:hypothetical protein